MKRAPRHLRAMRRLATLLLLAFCVALAPAALGQVAPPAAIDFRKHDTAADFAAATRQGVVVGESAGAVELRLDASALRQGSGPVPAGAQSYWYGTLESAPIKASLPFDTLIPSWNALTPAGTWIQLELRAFRPDAAGAPSEPATSWYNLGMWASGGETIQRQSVDGQRDAQGHVSTDTLLFNEPAYSHYQYRLTLFTTDRALSPSVSLVGVMASSSEAAPPAGTVESDQEAWGVELPVPQRSQMIYPGGGEVWCSPTSTSMVLAYWGHSVPVPDAAAATYDHVYGGNGNWPFNTAWAGSFGLTAYVTRLGSFAEVEAWISAGVPVIVSYAYGVGELPNARIPWTDGHVMVIRGFDAHGNVIANDPAGASDADVRVVYDRAILERLWLEHSRGTVYLIYPKDHAVPALPEPEAPAPATEPALTPTAEPQPQAPGRRARPSENGPFCCNAGPARR